MQVNRQHETQPSSDGRATVDVHVAVVSHGHGRFLEACLSSIFESTDHTSVEVTLVDNLEEPAVEELVRGRFKRVAYRSNSTPKSFAENNNSVFADGRSRYYFLLNPDTVVQPNAIDRLVEYMDEHRDLGACAPKLVYPDGRLQLSCRHFPSISSVLFRRTPLRILFANTAEARRYTMADWDHNDCSPIDWMFGAAIFARRQAWESVGPLDASMFLFCEDIDWCLRCHQAGWGIHFVPDAVIVHDFDEEKYNRYFTKSRWEHYRTMLRFFFKHPRYCLRW
jgi:GT2 family glycosyltransferase